MAFTSSGQPSCTRDGCWLLTAPPSPHPHAHPVPAPSAHGLPCLGIGPAWPGSQEGSGHPLRVPLMPKPLPGAHLNSPHIHSASIRDPASKSLSALGLINRRL